MTAVVLGGIAALVAGDLAWPRAPSRLRVRPTLARTPTARQVVAIAGAALVLVMAPPLAPAAGLAWWCARRLRAARQRAAHTRAIRHALPDLVDLLQLTTTAGMTLAIAHPLVAAQVPSPVGPALLVADAAARHGYPRADALLEALTPLGDRAHALAHILGDHLRYGVPLLPGLERAGLELRLDRRRAAELDARRVPVRLLAPLVTCVLPAFALLTVVPLLAASLEALPV
jgi:tight adherence protein C